MRLTNIIQSIQRFFQGKNSGAQCSGTIKFFDRKKRFGFIISGKNEYFFHAAAASASDFKALQDGVAVKFNIVQGKKGPQADNIEIVS